MRAVIILLLLPLFSSAEKNFDFNDNCRAAYNEIIQLKLNNGQQLIDREKLSHPDNLIPVFLENYIDFFTLFFNEDPAQYNLKRKLMDQRLDLIDQGPTSSPFFLFTKSAINFQWASVRLKFGYQWDGGWQLRRAFLDIKENQRKFPSFSPNAFYSGAMKVAVSTIPEGYKWLGNLLGLKSSGIDGLKQLEQFLRLHDPYAELFRNEATFHYLFLKFYVGNERNDVLQYMRNHQLDTRNNHLFAYLAVNLSINNQQSGNAQQIVLSRNNSPEYLQTGIWDLELGYAKMNHVEDDAAFYLERFLHNFKGKYYVKDVMHKLSWYYYLKNDQVSAEHYRKLVLESGNAGSDADKVALKEARSGSWPDRILLRTRLLNDGGYYMEALRLLQGKRAADFTGEDNRLEFVYRVARLYDDLNRNEDALSFYKQVINAGEKKTDYYAARSALQIGYIYEQRND
ncbi:MAG: hypothetical protein H0X41_04930, partial [Chitinophagaceae bacterium]|nr:hypothetical protein [Chitinophagaceae bacterium]